MYTRTYLAVRASLGAALVALTAPVVRSAPDAPDPGVAITLSTNGIVKAAAARLEAPLAFPGQTDAYLHLASGPWTDIRSFNFDVVWPEDAPTNAQVLVHMQDWDYFWYQSLLPGFLVPGKTNRLSVDIAPGTDEWSPRDHHGNWNLRALQDPKQFAIRIFCDTGFRGRCTIADARAMKGADTEPPFIRNVRTNTNRVPCYGKFEVTFEAPDRYVDPFDHEKVAVTATFETPTGDTIEVDGFYSQGYYRRTDAGGEHLFPQGPPSWKVRFAPSVPGLYRYRLKLRDAHGETEWGPAVFESFDGGLHGFVRVAETDPRHFELDDGSYFFPIGHNIRSPYDLRTEVQFPWTQRLREGSSAYARYFAAMAAHGENITEIWSSAWSLGLEWSEGWRGYHGIGQFNLMHAWETDRVLDEAERRNIRVNYVVHNHGKFGTSYDKEWEHNPFNTALGGYLATPEAYFTDARAMKSFEKLMRYTIARWGYSRHIFAWELWSELDLTGSKKDGVECYRRPEVVAWHQRMGSWIKQVDPYDHLVSTHVSSDYSKQNTSIIALPEMDLCPVDGYHGSADPVHIVTLMRATASFNNPYAKPTLITEFGGSPHAQSLDHLTHALHAALWASVGTPLGGAPMFWWWQIVDEENLYPVFLALSRFMEGEDRRDPEMKMSTPQLLLKAAAAPGLGVQCMQSPARAFGWIYHTLQFTRLDPLGEAGTVDIQLRLLNFTDGSYDVEFWDTISGKRVAVTRVKAESGQLTADVPPFARDVAFKIRPAGD